MAYTRENICQMLDANPIAVQRAIVFLYNEQTNSEKASSTTQVHNNRGFNYRHARYGSYCTRWILSGKNLDGKHLDKCRVIAKFYWRQLVARANSSQSAS